MEGSLSASMHSAIGEIAEDWQAVAAAGGFYSTAGCLAAFERFRPERGTRYLIVRQGRSPVAAAQLQVIEAEQARPLSDPHRLFFEGSGVARESVFPMLLFGARTSSESALLLRAGLEPELRRAALGRCLAEVESLAASTGAASIVLPYYATEELVEVSTLVGPHAVFALAPPSFYLPVPTDPRQYLAGLRRPDSIVSEMKTCAATGLAIELRHLSECDIELMAGQFLQVQRRYGVARTLEFATASFRTMREELDADSRVFLGMRNGEMVGFSLIIRTGDRYELRCVGFDYERQQRDFAYFNLSYYAPLQAAMLEGVREIDCGLESADGKLRRGCRVRARSFLIVPRREIWAEGVRAHVATKSRDDLATVTALVTKFGVQAALSDLDGVRSFYGS